MKKFQVQSLTKKIGCKLVSTTFNQVVKSKI